MRNETRLPGLIFLLAVLLLPGCADDEIDGLTGPRDETPNPDRYGALGNSLTAGFINGGLIEAGQVASYPNLLAGQAGWSPLEHPLVGAPGVGAPDASGIPQSALFVDGSGAITSTPVLDPLSLLRNATLPVPYDNLGIPGATTADILNATDAASSQSGTNIFFDAILRNSALPPGTWTALDQMTARNPNALTLWIGSNDVLGGMLSGDPQLGVNVTPPSIWETLFMTLADGVDATNATVIGVANIVNVAAIPYVITVPLAANIPGVGPVKWQMDEDTPQDPVQFVLLTAPVTDPDSAVAYLPTPFGTGERSLPSTLTLTGSEVTLLASTAAAYNTVIEREANARGWALADIASIMEALPKDPTNPANFAVVNGIFPWLTDPSSGMPFQNALSAFSLDGIHPSEIGQGVVANELFAALNATYNLGLSPIDLNTIQNVIGFEQAPSAPVRASLDANGRRCLVNLSKLLRSKP